MNVRTIVAVALAGVFAAVPLGAQGRGHGAPPAAGAPHGNPHPQGAGPKGGTHMPQGPKTPGPGAGHAEGARSGNAAKQGPSGQHADGTHGPMTPAEHLAAQPQLAQRLQGMLPAGMTVEQGVEGFKNLGQFVAAVNVSRNLGIPFDQLKAQVTGPSATPLGAAIQTLRPGADAKAEVARAETEARSMVRVPKK